MWRVQESLLSTDIYTSEGSDENTKDTQKDTNSLIIGVGQNKRKKSESTVLRESNPRPLPTQAVYCKGQSWHASKTTVIAGKSTTIEYEVS